MHFNYFHTQVQVASGMSLHIDRASTDIDMALCFELLKYK